MHYRRQRITWGSELRRGYRDGTHFISVDGRCFLFNLESSEDRIDSYWVSVLSTTAGTTTRRISGTTR
jgi:hypothetical protein